VTLTERGRAIREQAVAGRMEVVCASGLSEEQIQTLKRELDQLSAALRGQAEKAEGDGPREARQRGRVRSQGSPQVALGQTSE